MIHTPLSILVLIVCRNRRETTLAALERLVCQNTDAVLHIAVFDDASNDGTPEAIAKHYPKVQLIHGDGNAFWNGGLYRLWSATHGINVDAYLWLNDDTWLDDDAIARLVAVWHAYNNGDPKTLIGRRLILVGATRNLDGSLSYSGYDVERSPVAFRLRRIWPDDSRTIPISTFNGNIVLVGRGAVAAIGLNDPCFFHNLGDVDYGLRARRANIPVLLLPNTLGVCEINTAKSEQGYGSPRLSVQAQWRKVNTHHGLPFASWWRFTRRHSGRWWPLHFLLPYRHLLFFWKRESAARQDKI